MQEALSGAAEMMGMVGGGLFTVLLYSQMFLAWIGVEGVI